MIKSMTGFASLTHEDERATIGVTVKTVNHRFLDVQLRIPQSLAEIEPRVRALLQKRLARGRVEVAISVQLRLTPAPSVELNEEVVNALAAAIERARERGLVAGALTPGDLLRVPQAVSIRERPAEADPAAGEPLLQQRPHARFDVAKALRHAELDVEKPMVHRLHGDADGGPFVFVRQRRKAGHRFDHVVAGPVWSSCSCSSYSFA